MFLESKKERRKRAGLEALKKETPELDKKSEPTDARG